MLSTFDLAATLLIHVLSDEQSKVLKSPKEMRKKWTTLLIKSTKSGKEKLKNSKTQKLNKFVLERGI